MNSKKSKKRDEDEARAYEAQMHGARENMPPVEDTTPVEGPQAMPETQVVQESGQNSNRARKRNNSNNSFVKRHSGRS